MDCGSRAAGGRVTCLRGVIQIAHGMGEHSGRYSEPIAAPQEAGHVVYDRYRKAGVCNMPRKSSGGGRHQMLNELNPGEGRAGVLVWISAVFASKS